MKKILIFGGSGLLGIHAERYFFKKNYIVFSTFLNHKPLNTAANLIRLDLQNNDLVSQTLKRVNPDIVLNCSGLTSVEECEVDYSKAKALHEDFPEFLAKYSSDKHISNIHISTDHLWDGKKSFYKETDKPNALNNYGRTKAEGDYKVILNNPKSIIIRTNFFGKGQEWRQSFSDWTIMNLKKRNVFKGYDDIYFTPISIPFLLKYLDKLEENKAEGIFNIAGSERISKYEFILKIAKVLKLNPSLLKKAYYTEIKQDVKRPLDMSLDTEKIYKYLNQYMPNTIESIQSII